LISKRVSAFAAIMVIAVAACGGYVVHENRVTRNLAAQNQHMTVALNATRTQLDDLAAKLNMLAARLEPPPVAPADAVPTRRANTPHRRAQDSGLSKLQSQLDAQGKAIEETRNDLASTRGDLTNTRSELSRSIARTHDEVVLSQKKGEHNYYEFDIDKSKQFSHDGPVGIRLRKANTKHEYADLKLMVEDRDLSQKHVNIYWPVMFYTPDGSQPVALVINGISKDHIHGYVSASKYRQSELASVSNANTDAATGIGQTSGNSNPQSPPRQRLPDSQ